MRSWSGVGVVAVVVVVATGSGARAAPGALDKPAFTATPGELLALAATAPARDDDALVMLRDQRDLSIDEQGRTTERRRRVFVVHDAEAADEWGLESTTWRPFYQDRPTYRARVVAPGGAVTNSDPARATDDPTARLSPWVFSDQRRLELPLPQLSPGCVVEDELVITDREPILPGGGGAAIARLDDIATSRLTIVTLSAPAGRQLHHVARNLPRTTRTTHRIARGREIWTYEIAAAPDATHGGFEARSARMPYLGLGTAASWAAIAGSYRALLDQRIAAGPVSLPAELPRAPTIDTVVAILRWLHREVRYSQIDLDASTLTPATPAETVSRRYGTGLDKATLLVALLRQAGIRADLALIAVAHDRQVDPDLPEVNELDHSLVLARIGPRELWIDPIEDLSGPDQLRAATRGRNALVIADDTTALVTTPAARAEDNRLRRVRTFTASEGGPAEVTDTSYPTGVFEAEARTERRDTTSARLTRKFQGYARSEVGGSFRTFSSTDASDLATPFALTLEIGEAADVVTLREAIDVTLHPAAVLERVPPQLTALPETLQAVDYEWQTPHVYELENRIVAPAGFTLPAPAAERTRALGTARLVERQSVAGQTLTVTFRFETGKQRVTPDELVALKAALHALRDEVVHLRIAHTAFALLEAGKPREAAAEVEKLIARHPTEALHHGQLATIWVRAGAGQAGRREARKAVAMEPHKADPLTVLGWTLSHDTLGRRFVYDWDRAGAIAALQKARELDPRAVGPSLELAEVASRSAGGWLNEPGSDLRLALEAARAAFIVEPSDPHALLVVRLLLALGEANEAETTARDVKSAEREPLLVAAVAIARGVPEALRTAAGLQTGAAHSTLLASATRWLYQLRQYDLARAVAAATGTTAPQSGAPPHAARHDALRPDSKDPRDAVVEALVASATHDYATHVFWNKEVELRMRQAVTGTRHGVAPAPTPYGVLADAIQSEAQLRIEGNGDAWRATITVSGSPSFALYLAQDHGIARVLGDGNVVGAIGDHALELLDHDRDEAARRLLQWLADDVRKRSPPPVFTGFLAPDVAPDHQLLTLAAATLLSDVDPGRAISLLSRCRSAVPAIEATCKEALLAASAAGHRWADVERQIAAVGPGDPANRAGLPTLRIRALLHLGRLDDAERAIDDELARDPTDRGAQEARPIVALLRGQPDEAVKRADARAAQAGATPRELNLAAWLRLSAGRDTDVALDQATHAVLGNPAAGYLNTLAAIEAERGDLGRAVADNWKALAERPTREPDAADWYVTGRILEQLGLASDAVSAYRKIARDDELWGGAYELAARRLAALRVKP